MALKVALEFKIHPSAGRIQFFVNDALDRKEKKKIFVVLWPAFFGLDDYKLFHCGGSFVSKSQS